MSASSKKKLRKEQNAASLTEKQLKEQKEAKKLKVYSITFIALILVIAIIGVSVMAVTGINRSGIIDRNTIALNVGEHKVNSVVLNYYFSDLARATYNEWYNMYGESTPTYAMLMGLDVSKPLDQQAFGNDGGTWADNFLDQAKQSIQSDYALYDQAMADGFVLPEDEQKTLDSGMQNLQLYASLYGYSDVEDYLVSVYGFGSDEKSYNEYITISSTAAAYYNAHFDSLTYEDADIRAYEKDKFNNYSSYYYSSVYLPYTDFQTGGTTGEDGTVTYSEDEQDAARAAVKEAAEKLAQSANAQELDNALKALDVYKDRETPVTSTAYTRTLYTGITEAIRDWVSDSSRTENEVGYIASETTTTDEDGNESTVINGYYVVVFQGRTDNTEPLANVRHLLIKPKGGTKNEETGETTYTDAEWDTAKETAEQLLNTWKESEPTEESFIELIKEKSEDTSAETGGLFEDITPDSNYVPEFLAWSIDPDRAAGDTDVIKTQYGYHVMYYVGDDDLTYRDYMIINDIRTEDMNEWHEALMEPVTVTDGKLSRVNTDMIIGG